MFASFNSFPYPMFTALQTCLSPAAHHVTFFTQQLLQNFNSLTTEGATSQQYLTQNSRICTLPPTTRKTTWQTACSSTPILQSALLTHALLEYSSKLSHLTYAYSTHVCCCSVI
eukprot:TRINITY_DN296_c0_g1_i4.p3 TRINITY_DN296_c0_g1~~TRINITY_DN296_c0_g1_i4.p3  ORF type:complete len:114 (+),score=0.69 TRINITY_DN296_c0_g1_i4:240-581(+)